MGFYGNITNTNKTQFTFDRTYPNKAAMQASAKTDNVYFGRYVLIEYDWDILDSETEGKDYFEAYYDDTDKFFYVSDKSAKKNKLIFNYLKVR